MDLLADLRHAARMLRRSPGFTLVAVLTLALGIGANTAVFSLVNAALFRDAPGRDPDQLVWLSGRTSGGWRSLSYPEVMDHTAHDSAFAGVMAWDNMGLVLVSPGEPTRMRGLLVTADYFQVLGIRPALGRWFVPANAADPAVVLSHTLWRRRFAQDSGVIGTSVMLSGRAYTVVGVAPRGFNGIDLGEGTDLYLTFDAAGRSWPAVGENLHNRDAWWLRAVGRLRPGVTEAMARTRVEAEAERLAASYPREMRGTGATVEPLAGGMDPRNRREAVPIFALLMVVPGLVLLIACANLANLLLQRAAARQREIAVRRALGATRGRLIRQLLAESLLLGMVAGVLGVLLSFWIGDAVAALGKVPEVVTNLIKPDATVLGYALLVAVGTGLVFGLVPAINATRPRLTAAFSGDALAGTRFRRSRLVAVFLVAQVAVSLVLLVTAGLFLRTLDKATRVDPGFSVKNGVVGTIDLGLAGYDRARQGAFYRALLERAGALPGVEAASFTSQVPLSGRSFFTVVTPRDGDERAEIGAGVSAVWPGYFSTLGIPLRAGRDVTPRDDQSAARVVVINETLARRMFPGRSPLGQLIHLGTPRDSLGEVIGVVADGKYGSLTEEVQPFIFLPERQQPDWAPDMTLVVRTAGDPMLLVPALRRAVQDLDATIPLYAVRPVSQLIQDGLGKERAASALLASFGALAVLLAMVGLYGVMSYAVTRRSKEIGIRMALGAEQNSVLGMVIGEGVKLACIGILIGLALSIGVTRVIQRFLYGVTATDAPTFAVVAAALAGIAALASFLPARRATKVDPLVALRAE